jgi:hypothetical protein
MSPTIATAIGQAARASNQIIQGNHLRMPPPSVTRGNRNPCRTRIPTTATANITDKGIGRNAKMRAKAAITARVCVSFNGDEGGIDEATLGGMVPSLRA